MKVASNKVAIIDKALELLWDGKDVKEWEKETFACLAVVAAGIEILGIKGKKSEALRVSKYHPEVRPICERIIQYINGRYTVLSYLTWDKGMKQRDITDEFQQDFRKQMLLDIKKEMME